MKTNRINLNADALYSTVKSIFDKIPEHRRNGGNIKSSLADGLMSGLAIFAMKFPSLLKFDKARKDGAKNINLRNLFSIKNIPSDTQMRQILDEVNPDTIRPAFRKIFSQLQRGNELKKYQYLGGHYLIALDGTGKFASDKVRCEHCIQKKKKGGKEGEMTFHHQLLGASIVHPEIKQVIPLCPEPILNQDGSKKQDSELKSGKRWIEKFRKEHSKLRAIIIEDALSANAPHIKTLKKHDLRYIIGVTDKGHKALINQFSVNERHNLINTHHYSEIIGEKVKKKVTHFFKFIDGLSLNNSHSDIKVNLVDYRQITEYIDPTQDKKGIGTKEVHFTWITDISLSQDNIVQVMRAGRSRWRIENENFKTLKEETSYNLEHSYGHGKKYLCTIFAYLTYLSFLIDQTQELVCDKFNKALQSEGGTKRDFWQCFKAWFRRVVFKNWNAFYGFFTKVIPIEELVLVDSG